MISLLEQAGYETWLVGGYIRNVALGIFPCTDYDISTQAQPEIVVDLAKKQGFSCSSSASRFGTIAASKQLCSLEITTMRTESSYIHARYPSSVNFCSCIKTDLARRDFRLNSMAWHPLRGIFDPFGGLRDIQDGLIRTTQDPQRCFDDDALRILRALRFIALTGFELDVASKIALKHALPKIKELSFHRVQNELTKLLVSPYAGKVLNSYRELFAHIIPEIRLGFDFDQKSPYHSYSVWEHTLKVLDLSPHDPLIRWAALFHDIGKPLSFTQDATGRGHFYNHEHYSCEITRKYLRLFNFSKRDASRIAALVFYHDKDLGDTWSSLVSFMLDSKTGISFLKDLLALKFADELGKNKLASTRIPSLQHAEIQLLDALHYNKPSSIKDLAITGSDLLACGMSEGPQIRNHLEQLLMEISRGKLSNTRESLLEAFL